MQEGWVDSNQKKLPLEGTDIFSTNTLEWQVGLVGVLG